MIPSAQPRILTSPIATTLSSWVLDTFEIDQQQYWVVLLAGLTQSLSGSRSNSTSDSLSATLSVNDILGDRPIYYTEVSRFKVGDQLCAVVKIDQDRVEQERVKQNKIEQERTEQNKIEQNDNADVADLALLLTNRELQIATLVALGQPNKQIGRQLHISEWTVSTHLRRIFIKLGVDSRAAMVYRCAGLIQKLQGR